MNIREISKPITAKALNESLAKKFGARINLDKFTFEQLEDARNKLRTKLSQVETTESFNAVHTAQHSKDTLFLDVLNAAIVEREDERVSVSEGKEDEAEIVMAAKDMVDRLTGWMEDTAEMQSDSMLELADAIRDELGSEKSESFVSTIKPALDSLYTAMEQARGSLTGGVGMLTGEGDVMSEPMGGEGDMDMEPTIDADDGGEMGDLDLDVDNDEFAADDAAMGGDAEEGRAKRESVDRNGVNEISSDMAKRYKKNAKVDRDNTDDILKRDGSTNDWKANAELQKRNSKRTKGMNRADKRITKEQHSKKK